MVTLKSTLIKCDRESIFQVGILLSNVLSRIHYLGT